MYEMVLVSSLSRARRERLWGCALVILGCELEINAFRRRIVSMQVEPVQSALLYRLTVLEVNRGSYECATLGEVAARSILIVLYIR